MIDILVFIQASLAVLLTIAVLMQKSSSIGLGAYSGSNDSVFGAKGPANFLTKATFILGIVFVINTLVLVYLYNKDYSKSVVDDVNIENVSPVKTPKTVVPDAPIAK
jgi:preprotein translocase subunit SecG